MGIVGGSAGRTKGIVGAEHPVDQAIVQQPDPAVAVMTVFAHRLTCRMQKRIQVGG